MTTQRIVLALTTQAFEALADNASERKRGELASRAIMDYIARQKLAGGEGLLEVIAQRLERIETRLERIEVAKQ